MKEIDSLMLYGIAMILFALFSHQHDVMFRDWSEILGWIGFAVCTASLIGNFIHRNSVT
ncbi:hypothetical protein SAMN04488556_2201 [Halostagnicola kamekurae]|uniref:Uncharacterized protein n=1 Tax=Halostagnicola kamekurae TaxID=619731 RepID=A0A1I6RVG7_9EURY|nr:hypothetical protein SAMN04488556_2201 [Halostagnicola kamekurae]